MEDKKQNVFSKELAVKIMIPVLIVIVIGAIWLIKNTGPQAPSDADNSLMNTAVDSNPDLDLHVTEAIDMEKLKSYGLPIIIDFGADSCIPCKEMAPVLEKLNKDLRGKAIIKFVDVWKYQELAQGYPISVIPTQVLFDKNGKPFIPSNPQGMQMTSYTTKENPDEVVFTTHEGGMTEDMMLNALKEMGMEE